MLGGSDRDSPTVADSGSYNGPMALLQHMRTVDTFDQGGRWTPRLRRWKILLVSLARWCSRDQEELVNEGYVFSMLMKKPFLGISDCPSLL